jgi:hypothetical protein
MKEASKVLLTGGTGFVGNRLVDGLVAAGHTVSVVTRTPERHRSARAGVDYVGWLPDLQRYQAVVNLAGAPIFGTKWTAAVKDEIRSSRVESTRRLVEGLRAAQPRPAVLVSASAIGWYGERGDEPLSEGAGPGTGFLAEVCQAWEAEALAAEELGVRVVRVRIGVVLGPNGGALQQMLLPFKLGLGGPIGSGAQWFSWVHLRDLVALLVRAVEDETLRGAVNGTAPNPVTNKEYARTLGHVLHRPTVLSIPPFALRLRFGEAAEVLTASLRCLPEAALKAGFEFRFGTLEGALRDILA